MNKPSFGKFQIVGQIARGGMADIFLCRLQGIGGFEKEVVIKCILPERATDPDFVTMFLDEARVAANLNHPGIVQVFEIGEEGGVPYIAMEYVKGVTLQMVVREMHRQKKMHYGHCAKIISGVCEALDYAHNATSADGERLDLVHRDVSPANIIISREGVPKLLDFGVAKANKRLSETQAGTLKGKLRYMAPEQMSQETVDARADIFSVGVCLFELTTFRHPYAQLTGTESSLLANVLHGTRTKPSEVVPGYPPALESIIIAATERDPAQRIPTAREMHTRLEAFVASGPHASSSRDVVAWLKELFPDFGSLTKTGGLTAFNAPSSGARPASKVTTGSHRPLSHSSSLTPLMPGLEGDGLGGETPAGMWKPPGSSPPPRGSSLWKWALTVSIGLGAAGVGAWYLRPRPEVTVAPPPVQPAPAPADDDPTARKFMDEAERLAKEKRFEPALEMLTKATKLRIQDPELSIRLTRLRDTLSTASLILKAGNQLRQREWEKAIETAKDALDRDPENPDAPQIIASARAALAPAHPPPSKGRDREPRREGTLTISTTPPATVYVDDEPIGRTPLSRSISAGSHRVQVRTHGYRPGQADIRVSPGQTVALVLPLVADAPPPPRPASTDDDNEPPARPSRSPSVVASRPSPTVTPPPVEPPRPPPEEPKRVEQPPPPVPRPAIAPSPPPTPPKPAASTAIVSTMPHSPIPKPTLPRVVSSTDGDAIARACQMVELLAVSRAGVSREFARGVTGSMRRQLPGGARIYPVAIYYFIVREAALRHDNFVAAANLAAAQADGSLAKMKDLPAIERDL